MSESQKQLLKTMLFYDLQNHVLLRMEELRKEPWRVRREEQELYELEIVCRYIENRISQLGSNK